MLKSIAFEFVELNVTVGSVKEACLHRPSCDVMRRIRHLLVTQKPKNDETLRRNAHGQQ